MVDYTMIWVLSQMIKYTLKVLRIVPDDAMNGDQDVLDSPGEDKRAYGDQQNVTWNIGILFQ